MHTFNAAFYAAKRSSSFDYYMKALSLVIKTEELSHCDDEMKSERWAQHTSSS